MWWIRCYSESIFQLLITEKIKSLQCVGSSGLFYDSNISGILILAICIYLEHFDFCIQIMKVRR